MERPALKVLTMKEVEKLSDGNEAEFRYSARMNPSIPPAVPRRGSGPLPRVTSHEIGHALSLNHRQDRTNLMASGTTGFSLNEAEIKAAREMAAKFQKPAATDAAQTDSTK